MSALAGMWSFDGRPDAAASCERVLSAQAIYGPHDAALWDGGAVSLGRRLFNTLPEDAHDAQPVHGGGGRFVLVADVRLDNRDDLITALALHPDAARRMPDSAIVMAAWERWGEGTPERLVGDYAFVVWDKAEQGLHLVRDPLGGRPLHYHQGTGFFVFASMPVGLHALPDIPRAPDEERIAEFLLLMPQGGPRSFFQGISRIEPGHMATVTPGGVSNRLHWRPQRRTLRLASSEAYAEGLRHHLDQAVRAQLRGAGDRVGAHLSSGFDSGAVVSSAALQTTGKVIAFTSVPRPGYDGADPKNRHGDEGPGAAATAALYPNIEHVLVFGQGGSPLDELERDVAVFGQPIQNPCNLVWMAAINRAARQRELTVMLTGQMGNATISHAGELLLPDLLRQGRWWRWMREALAMQRSGRMGPRGVFVASFAPYLPAPVWSALNKLANGSDTGPETYSALRSERLAELDLPARAKARGLDLDYRPRKDGFESRLWIMRRSDLGNVHKGMLGAWGVDQRDPTADRRLIEYCLSVPDEENMRDGQLKVLARRAFAGRLPASTLKARTKGLQAVDWHEGATAALPELKAEIERLRHCAPAAAALDLERLQGLVDDWPLGGWEREDIQRAYRLALLRGLAVGGFLRRATGSNA